MKKHQVFISSTKEDLKDAREAVTWALLKGEHIPVGMESFSASNDRGWETITRQIDRSDYYVVIIAGRYGSIDKTTGVSWTQREYEYAKELGVPRLVFIRKDASTPGNLVETQPKRRKLHEAFIGMLRKERRCEDWSSVDGLTGQVAQAITNAIKRDEESGTPRPGWHRVTVTAVRTANATIPGPAVPVKRQTTQPPIPLQSLWGDAKKTLAHGDGGYLLMSLAPDRPGTLRFVGERMREDVFNWLVQQQRDDGMNFEQVLKPQDVWADHKRVFVSGRPRADSRPLFNVTLFRNGPGIWTEMLALPKPDVILFNPHYVVMSIHDALMCLARHARQNCEILVTGQVEASVFSPNAPMEIDQRLNGYSGHERRRVPDFEPSTAQLDLDRASNSATERLRICYQLIAPLVQQLHVDEPLVINADGAIQSRYWPPSAQGYLMNWARKHGVTLI